MKTLEFHTPTKVDLRELFTLGLGSKRGVEGKIGHKGSGMKFTLALLHRLNSSLEVVVGGMSWVSIERPVEIRDQRHSLIHLTDCSGSDIPCHISINAGADTWKEPWFALRELLQNCIDEGGRWSEQRVTGFGENGTIMRIAMTPELEDAWAAKDDWHQPAHPEIIYTSRKPGLFYHGFRIFEATDWHYTYDATSLIDREHLSEDRQLRNVNLSDLFADAVKQATHLPTPIYTALVTDAQPPGDVKFISDAIYNAIDDSKPNFGGFTMALFEQAFVSMYGERACWTQAAEDSAEVYHARAAGYTPVHTAWHTSRIARYSKVIKSAESLLPTIDKRLARVAASTLPGDALDKLKLALKLTKKLRPDGCAVEVVEALHSGDELRAAGLAVIDANKVLVLKSHVQGAPLLDLVNTLVEEFMHLRSKASDCTRPFEAALVSQIATMLMPKPRRTADVL